MIERVECFECGQTVAPRIESRQETLPVRGEPTQVASRVAVCPECGSDVSIEELDNATLVAAFNLYREKHGLMTPEEMVRLRKRYGLGVRAFSLLLGWGEITLHRYEGGSLQDAAHEAALRLAEEPANIRVFLNANGHKLTVRQRSRLESHLQALDVGERAACAPDLQDRFVVREDQDRYGGWAPMQLSKLREMMVWFGQSAAMYPTKLNKLLFYTDFEHYREQGVSVSGSPYLAMQRGPVPEHYDWIQADLIEGGDISAEEVFFPSGGSGTILRSLREPDLSVFTEEELATIRAVAERLAHKTGRELSDMSHRERAWIETPQGQLIEYSWARELSA
jgi:putative zinc finger/helix-turn-helix YgiT family protein